MLYSNRDLDRAFEFIEQSDFDIFCLQEVSKEFLERLKTSLHHLTYASESNLISRGKHTTIFNATLSKYPIIRSNAIPLKHYEPTLPLRSRFVARIMYGLQDLQIWVKGLGNRHALCVDTNIPGYGCVRVFNLHLPLMHPNIRKEEFKYAMLQKDPQLPTIVCGDFNILEKLHITPINWLLGGRFSDVFFHHRERTVIEKHFVEYELTNALSGRITHPLSRSQLDHILVSNSFSIKNTEVISDRYGSDHHPIFAELT
ncbi:MAG: endonuclease/exonuclease/phosphatase family protein [Candidatus Kaiserbacteria bacterium]|nr:endonuclease/exonuclease/phosphatase family protein [Candidatus Kaiserbacteria bacterium]